MHSTTWWQEPNCYAAASTAQIQTQIQQSPNTAAAQAANKWSVNVDEVIHMKTKVLLVLVVLTLVVGGYFVTVNSGGTSPLINSNRTVEMVEFSDFQCPYCAAVVPTVKQVLATYGDHVKFEYKNFPVHTNAWKAAEAYEIASQYGKGMEYYNVLFANQNALDVDSLKKYARQVGIPGDEFDRLLDSGAMSKNISADQAEGERLGVTGTPTFFIDGRMLVGAQPYSEFEKIINEELYK